MRPRFFATLIDAPAALSGGASKINIYQMLAAISCQMSRAASLTSRSEGADVEAAIDRYVLAREIAGMDRAEKGADLAEFLRRSEPLGRDIGADAGLARGSGCRIFHGAGLMLSLIHISEPTRPY